jgi:lipopolysaccharide transport system permease protein
MRTSTISSASPLNATTTTETAQPLTAPQSPDLVPEKPLITIESTKSWRALRLREFWEYRELLYFLTWRDVKVRYKQTLLGVVWVVLQPLVTMLIFTLLFGRLAGLGGLTGGIPYPLFAFAGLLPWMFFANALSNSSNSLVTSTQLITKIYFPRAIIPAASVAASLVDFALSFLVLAVLLAYYHVGVTWNLLLLVPLVVLLVLLALGLGMLLSALNVKYRDVRHAVPFLVQIWMFASPVIYPPTLVPVRWRWVLALNPITGIIEGFRAALFGRTQIEWKLLAISVAITLAVFVFSIFAFKRMEKSFADVI